MPTAPENRIEIELDTGKVIKLRGQGAGRWPTAVSVLADHLWHVGSPGAMTTDFAHFAYTKRDGNFYPRIEDPWAIRGTPKPVIFQSQRSA